MPNIQLGHGFVGKAKLGHRLASRVDTLGTFIMILSLESRTSLINTAFKIWAPPESTSEIHGSAYCHTFQPCCNFFMLLHLGSAKIHDSHKAHNDDQWHMAIIHNAAATHGCSNPRPRQNPAKDLPHCTCQPAAKQPLNPETHPIPIIIPPPPPPVRRLPTPKVSMRARQ